LNQSAWDDQEILKQVPENAAVYLRHDTIPIEDNSIIDSTDLYLSGIIERMKLGEEFSKTVGIFESAMKQSKISFVDRRIAHYSAKNCLRFQNEA
jgi:hypothetical protein